MNPLTKLTISSIILAIAVLMVHAEVFWERRTLNCTYTSPDPLPKCDLYLRKEFGNPVDPQCFEEPNPKNSSQTRYSCVLRCPDASTDSVTLKVPQWRHKCVSHHSYGTDKIDLGEGHSERHMWKTEACLYNNVSLSIWCKFSTDDWPDRIVEV